MTSFEFFLVYFNKQLITNRPTVRAWCLDGSTSFSNPLPSPCASLFVFPTCESQVGIITGDPDIKYLIWNIGSKLQTLDLSDLQKPAGFEQSEAKAIYKALDNDEHFFVLHWAKGLSVSEHAKAFMIEFQNGHILEVHTKSFRMWGYAPYWFLASNNVRHLGREEYGVARPSLNCAWEFEEYSP